MKIRSISHFEKAKILDNAFDELQNSSDARKDSHDDQDRGIDNEDEVDE